MPQASPDIAPLLAEAAAHYDAARLAEAEAVCRAILAADPGQAGARHMLAAIAFQSGDHAAAADLLGQAIALDATVAEYHSNLGVLRREQGRLTEAEACSRRAIGLDADCAEAHFNLGQVRLALGDLAEGWREYEWRFRSWQQSRAVRSFRQPQWQGEPAPGRTLLLHAEQGLGDTLQFCRFVELAAAASGGRVILEVQQPLFRLLHGLPGAARVITFGAMPPQFDLHCPLLSLPLALSTTLETIPPAPRHLRADPARVAAMGARLAMNAGRKPRIGVAWAGNPRTGVPTAMAIARRRSVPPALLAPLFEVAGVAFFSLQKGGPPAPANAPLTDLMPEVADVADTAVLVENLDLVIAVDTAVAHLAAALGKPVWLLDRFDHCWRWLAGRRDSPWYPTLRIYRQPAPGDWDSVIAEVARDLRGFGA